ncbi:MAG: DUF308 domain-containing protein [Bacilli bacterium]|nr:DUF308 domain-containing protein [Bacilli bacterium]MCI6932351.1 DUF308 domain-containing protein [Mycoplasmatota bacterium]
MLNKLNKYLNSGIILTIVFLLVGGILIVKPDISFNIISYLIGASLIVSGIYLFIIDSKTKNIFINVFLYAILLTLIGILIILNPITLKVILPIFLGLWFLISGIFKIRLDIYMKDEPYFILSLITNIITVICGVILLINPVESVSAITISLGIIIVVSSISSLIDIIIFKKNINSVVKYLKEEYTRFSNFI